MLSLIELCNDDESAWDQSCRYGHRVGTHAVYCHNSGWNGHPEKCHRTWYTSGKLRDEDCIGFDVNIRQADSDQTLPVKSVFDYQDEGG